MVKSHQTLNTYANKWLAFIGIALLSFGCYLDYTVVNVALPTIQQELHTDLTSLQWVMNIYFLALCILATIMGRLGDVYGRRRCFYIGSGIFAVASIVAGLAPTIDWLIFGRLLQGIGAAIVLPLGPSLLPQSFPKEERGKSIAWLGSMGGIALALGPVLGGVIVMHWSWRWIFFINIPIILLGYILCFKSVNESSVEQKQSFLDIKGMVFLTLAMGGIVLSLIHSQTGGWNNSVTLTYLIIGIVSTALLIFVEKQQDNPLIDFRDFSNLLFYAGSLLCFLAGVLSAVTLFFDPLYLQIIRNESVQLSGLVLFAIPIAVFTGAFFVGWLISRLGIVNTILLGLIIALVAATLQLFFISTTPLWYVIIAFICLGFMWGLGNTVPIIAAQTAVGPDRISAATGTIVTMFNVGGSIGLAIAVVTYHFFTSNSLNQLSQTYGAQIDAAKLNYLKKIISTPSDSLHTVMNEFMHTVFNEIFLGGFTAVMWFIVILSSLSFFSVLIWKMIGHRTNATSRLKKT